MKERKSDGPMGRKVKEQTQKTNGWMRRGLAVLALSLLHSFALSLFAQTTRNGVGPEQRYYAVHSFADDWLVYDEAAKAYVPYLPEIHADAPAVSASIDLESNRHYQLLLYTDTDSYVFINAALKKQLLGGRWYTFSIDSLYNAYRQPRVLLSIYGSAGVAGKQMIMGYPKSILQKPVVLSDDNLSVRPRTFSVYQNFFGLGLLFLLAIHALLFSLYRRAFLVLYDPRDLFALRVRDESFLINRPLSRTVLLFLISLSFVMGYLFLFVQSRNVNVFSSRTLLLDQQNFGALLLYYLLVSVLVFLSFLGKYLMLQVVGSLYRFESVVNIHFFKVVQSSLLFFTAIGFLAAIVIFNGPAIENLTNYLLIPFTVFYLVRLVLLYLVIRAQAPIKSLYLISYLCIVELVPLLIGVRFAL
ncbi:DUF4271 domain-containing protein [Rudanella lutea]|uniref:DUF4271 domain-containing protein n=1 Tax=Rudanella lutea TaxID=451374 RepID=UPI001FDEB466|nr:DUF4271 domain-containing protein [Rudanella lutea]